MPIYKSKDKTKDGRQWYFVVSNGYQIVEGKKKTNQYKSKKYTTKKECEKAQADFLLYHNNKKGTAMPMNILTHRWFEEYKDSVKIQTQQKIERCITFIDKYFGDMPVTKITDDVYKGFRNYLNEYTYYRKRLPYRLKSDQKNKIHNYFKKVLQFSKDEFDVTYEIPAKYGNFAEVKQDAIKDEPFYDYDELLKLFEATDSDIYRAFFVTLGLLGLREGEANGLKIEDINLKENTLTINRTISTKIFVDGKYLESSPKTKASHRTLSMPKMVRQSISDLIDKWSKYEGYNEQWYVFGGFKPLAESSMSTNLKRAIKKAGLKDAHLHSLRKSCASLLYNNGVTPLVVQKILGHEDLKTTLTIYAQVYRGKDIEAINFIDSLSDM